MVHKIILIMVSSLDCGVYREVLRKFSLKSYPKASILRAGDVVQLEECLPSTPEALGLPFLKKKCSKVS